VFVVIPPRIRAWQWAEVLGEVAVVVGEMVVKPRPANKPRLVGAQRASRHRGCAKRNGRRNNKYYFAHELSSLGDA
jgi:hypothetical protein